MIETEHSRKNMPKTWKHTKSSKKMINIKNMSSDHPAYIMLIKQENTSPPRNMASSVSNKSKSVIAHLIIFSCNTFVFCIW